MFTSYSDQYDVYTERLLLSQYDISDIFEHEATKGTVREDFLIHLLNQRYSTPLIFTREGRLISCCAKAIAR